MKDKNKLIEVFQSTGLVPLFSHENIDVAQQMVEAAYRGGARVVEFTNRKPNAIEVFSHLVKHKNNYPEMSLGIGTVMDAVTTQKFIDAGADFIISPILKPEMSEVCKRSEIPWIPGGATLTEIVTAHELGAAVIKVFPGSVLGPAFISSILPVVPNLKLMITGGVELNEVNLRAWFKAGSLCVGLGSHLFKPEIILEKSWDKLEGKISEALSIIKKIKSDLTS
jgi:2-dehydro-3-deoxyphosphogluconate aldolase / (4S)-4-hydroxy-2-oxoglutarate aldolase